MSLNQVLLLLLCLTGSLTHVAAADELKGAVPLNDKNIDMTLGKCKSKCTIDNRSSRPM